VSIQRAIAGAVLQVMLAIIGPAMVSGLCHAQTESHSQPGVQRLPPVATANPHEVLPLPELSPRTAPLQEEPFETLNPGIQVFDRAWERPMGSNPALFSFGLPPVHLAHTPLNFNIPLLMQQTEYAWDTHLPPEGAPGLGFDLLVRSAYLNDQRIEWSGNEATFVAESILGATLRRIGGEWETTVRGEFYLNQPFDRNRYLTPGRESYANNFEVDVYEISQLFVAARRGNFLMSIGKIITPFGRAYFPIYENSREDAPFIRTESILWRETGVLLQYAGGLSVLSAGLVNGGIDRDTNSSKALIGRAGFGRDNFDVGVSIKWQDGIGSEHQKLRGNHLGADAMYRWGRWQFSGEVIYDEYGFRKSGTTMTGEPFTAEDITWGRSLYNRELLAADGRKLTGIGYYVNLNIDMERWLLMFNYGEYYPRQIGDHMHDQINRRGIVKLVYRLGGQFESYTMVLRENGISEGQVGKRRNGISVLSGLQFML